jgi:hypothetical protein
MPLLRLQIQYRQPDLNSHSALRLSFSLPLEALGASSDSTDLDLAGLVDGHPSRGKQNPNTASTAAVYGPTSSAAIGGA